MVLARRADADGDRRVERLLVAVRDDREPPRAPCLLGFFLPLRASFLVRLAAASPPLPISPMLKRCGARLLRSSFESLPSFSSRSSSAVNCLNMASCTASVAFSARLMSMWLVLNRPSFSSYVRLNRWRARAEGGAGHGMGVAGHGMGVRAGARTARSMWSNAEWIGMRAITDEVAVAVAVGLRRRGARIARTCCQLRPQVAPSYPAARAIAGASTES